MEEKTVILNPQRAGKSTFHKQGAIVKAARDLYRIWNPPLSGDAQEIVRRARAWNDLRDALTDAGLLP